MPFDPSIGKPTQWRKGQSGNAGGRPKSRLLSEALRRRLAQIKEDDFEKRSYAEILADHLLEIAFSRGPAAVAAACEVANRVEGRSPQTIHVTDFAADLQARSDQELEFYLAHNRWPDDGEAALLLSAPSDAPPA
jgi:hypothetical protein